MQSESAAFIRLTQQVYRDFGFDDIELKLSTRPEQRIGSDDQWDRAGKALEPASKDAGLEDEPPPGTGAFYRQKIEFSLRESLSRVWHTGTLQPDCNRAVRLGAE